MARGALVRYFDYYRKNDTGRVREVTSRSKLPCALSAGTARGSLAKGSWHAAGVTEGFTAGTFPKVQTHVETCQPFIPPPRRCRGTPTMARGALVRYFDYYRKNDTGPF